MPCSEIILGRHVGLQAGFPPNGSKPCFSAGTFDIGEPFAPTRDLSGLKMFSAQRHGLRALPVDITRSLYECSLEDLQLRLGLNYVRGLRAQTSREIVEERNREPFADIDNLARRVRCCEKMNWRSWRRLVRSIR
jgi:hypothetical protein